MMKAHALFVVAFASACAVAGDLPPWRTPAVNSINRLPARSLLVPCESEDIAIGIAEGSLERTASRWVQSLNGTWDFKWKSNVDKEWEKTGKITVPSCWQLQGEYDPPLYTNVRYPLAFDGSGDPMIEPPKDFTSYAMRNPVALYTTTFSRPWRWWFRRTVLRFHGVSSAFYVRVNGKEVGYAEDSRLPSEFDVTPYLKVFGSNTLEVEVYKHSDGTYLEDQDFWRLSGIFRDVYLVSEHKDAPKDFVVETEIADDLKSGKFTLRDEKGGEIKVRDVGPQQFRLWSAEYPYVYITPVEHKWGWWIFGGVDHYTAQFGFRKIEIRDSVIYLNGKRLLFKGADRHEMQPESGYSVTMEGMKKDISILKSFNLNAVRTCHYPDTPDWYDLCDREGIMLVCEANVESHGAGYGEKSLAKHEEWQQSHVERGTRMVQFYRNHPSILIWSMGNEAGDGINFEAEYKAMRAIDATRPIQYEGAQDSDHSDIKCPMYMPPKACEQYVANNPKKPLVLCEYTHAMGNSNGGIQEYWDLAKKYPSFQGGFIWDFVDQAIWKTDEKGKWLAYGGDFGDKPNDDNFNCNGFIDATRWPHPGAFEIRHAYQSIHVTDFDWATGKAKIENGYLFTPLEEFDCSVELAKDGADISSTPLDVEDVAADSVKEVTVDVKDADVVTFLFYRDEKLVAWDQFAKPFVAKAAPQAAGEASAAPFKMNFWRAPTDNDRGWRMGEVCKVWKDATDTQKLPEGVTSDLKVSKLADGRTLVDWTLVVPKGLPPIPRVGLTFTVPKNERTVEWYGLGPWENYSDRATGALLATHKATVDLVNGLADADGKIPYARGRLNPDNYIEPGEQGYRTGVRRLTLGALELEALNAPFGFNAWPYSQKMLEGKKHQWELSEEDAITLNVDAVQMGVGGDNSWGARPHDAYMPKDGTYRLVFAVKGL